MRHTTLAWRLHMPRGGDNTIPSASRLSKIGLIVASGLVLMACQTVSLAPVAPISAKPALGSPSSPIPQANPRQPAPVLAPQTPVTQPAPTPPAPPNVRALKIGLALGGGAARGFAHVGVIKALEARGIHPDIVVGTSVGSFVGALYASGYSGTDLERVAMQFEQSSITDWSMPARGLLKGQALQDFVNRAVQQRPIEAMRRKLAIVATDLNQGTIMVFERGDVGMAVRASSSVPGVFRPTQIEGRDYVDGGLVSPVPAATARRLGADVVIAVDISKRPSSDSTKGAFDILLQTFTIMEQVIAHTELSSADIVLHPANDQVGSTDFKSKEASIRAGEAVVAEHFTDIQRAIDHAHQNLVDVAVLQSAHP